MKIAIFILSTFFVLNSFGQDSVKVTIQPQARDLEYIASFVYNDNACENLYDSIKAKFRVAVPPTGNTTVSITATSGEWVLVMQRLKTDEVSIDANCTSRMEALLLALNNSYITTKITDLTTSAANLFQDRRQFGRARLRRLNN